MMKVYRTLPPAISCFYEKQSDIPKGMKFTTVEFPFNASPKADFVAWLNDPCGEFAAAKVEGFNAGFVKGEDVAYAGIEARGVAQPQPVQPVQPQSQIDRAAIDAMWPSLPLAYRFGLCAMTMEDARNTDFFQTTPGKAQQGYGGVK